MQCGKHTSHKWMWIAVAASATAATTALVVLALNSQKYGMHTVNSRPVRLVRESEGTKNAHDTPITEVVTREVFTEEEETAAPEQTQE